MFSPARSSGSSLEVKQDEGGGSDLGEEVGVEGDELQGGPGSREQGVAAFSHGPKDGQELVAGDVVDVGVRGQA